MVGCGGANPAPNSTGEPSSEPSEATGTSLQEGKLENTTPTDGSELPEFIKENIIYFNYF